MEKEIAKKLLEFQANLNAPKNMRNSFGNYSYRSAESILEACKKLQKGIGVTITLNDEIVLVGEHTYIKATATITDVETGQSYSTNAFARESYDKKGMDPSQMTGATSSYARKYALNALLAIDDNKDPDTDEFRYLTEEQKVKAEEEAKKAYQKLVSDATKAVKAAKTTAEVKDIYNRVDKSVQKEIYDLVAKIGKELKAKEEANNDKA